MQVRYISHMGSDLDVVNDARVSFGKQSEWQDVCTCHYQLVDGTCHVCGLPGRSAGRLKDADANLIRFLARGCSSGDWATFLTEVSEKGYDVWSAGFSVDGLEETIKHIRRMPTHWTPFAGSVVKLHVKVPVALAAQFKRSEAGRVLNEVSRRYVDDEPEIFLPEVWRRRAANVKQGSSDEATVFPDLHLHLHDIHGRPFVQTVPIGPVIDALVSAYNEAVRKDGPYQVCPEQARFVLPQGMYTEMRVTGSLYYWARVYTQRADAHAQREWAAIVAQMDEIIRPLFPVAWEALTS